MAAPHEYDVGSQRVSESSSITAASPSAAAQEHVDPAIARGALARRPGEPEAIFVVGVARSGTTLMRLLLETSDRIGVARENHYMAHIFGRRGARHYFRRAGDLADDATIRRIVQMLYGGEYQRHSRWRAPSPYWRWLVESVPREEMEKRLLNAERTERGLFGAFLQVYADVKGKAVMGEKTPTHLAYIDTLLEWFPDGRVIHMLRDPRAIYVSDRHRRRSTARRPYTWLMKIPLLLEMYLLMLTIVNWRAAVDRHGQLQRRHAGRYMLVRFEDLVQRPDETVRQVFEFIGVATPPNAATQVAVRPQHGMRSTEKLDPEAADRWRSRIHPLARHILTFALRARMRRFGYSD
jgi:hypothetical protein